MRRLSPRLPLLAGLITMGLLMGAPALRAQSNTGSYLAGKSLTIVVNQAAGQQRDLEARVYAQFLKRHLRGNPDIKIVNMAGAAGLRAVRSLHKATKPDGLTIGYLSSTLPTQQLLEKHKAADEVVLNLDLLDFAWISGSGSAATVFFVTKPVPYRTANELLFGDERKFTVAVGATRPGSTTFIGPAILVEVFGAPIRILTGYESGERDLAMMRGELQGNFGRWGGTIARNRDWFADGTVRPLLSMGVPIPQAELDKLGIKHQVPDVFNLVKDPNDEAFLRLALYPSLWGSPIVAPPRTPEDRVAILREGFEKLRNDPEFQAAVQKRDVDLNPIPAATARQWVTDYLYSPATMVKRYLNMVEKN